MIETGTDLKLHFELFGEFDRARLHDLGAEAGELQHFVVGNLVDLPRVRHEARIGGVDAVDHGVNLAGVSLVRGRHRDGGQGRCAAPQRAGCVMWPFSFSPWKPATMTTWPESRCSKTFLGVMLRIFALVCMQS